MRRDILFFTKGIPQHLRVGDSRYILATVAHNGLKVVEYLQAEFLDFDFFVKKNAELPLHAFIYRIDSHDRSSALKAAYRQLSGLLDGYALVTDDPPKLSAVALIREGESDDAHIHSYFQGGWATVGGSGKAIAQWEGRNSMLLGKLTQFFDVVSKDPSAPQTEITTNLLYALRMHRRGAASDCPGIEFLAKFSALESLVCGAATQGKENLLRQRLPALFDSKINPEQISNLWKLRCSASHQARAFSEMQDDDSYPPSMGTSEMEPWIAGAVYFTLDNMYNLDTFDELWAQAEEYTLPELIVDHRPAGLNRMAVTQAILNTQKVIRGAGKLFDAAYSQNRS